MTGRLRNLLGRAWEQRHDLLCGIERFPVAIAALAVFVVAVNLEIAEITALGTDRLTRFGAATSSAAALATAAILFFEVRGRAGVRAHLVSLLLALVAGVAVWRWRDLGVAPAALLAGAALLVPLAPYAGRRRGFWSFVWALANAAALSFVAIAVFCAGVSAILASLEYLFDLDVESSVYGHVWSTGLGFVGPLFALSQVPTAFPEADEPDPKDFIVAGIRVLADFVAVPLLAIYAAILHAYAAKIAAEAELPRGQVGWMVLSFGLAVLALRIVVDPFAPFSRASTRLFLRWWAPPLVVPLVLLVIAVWQRVGEYGFTPERYALALFAVFLAGVLAAQLASRTRNDIRLVPAFGALLLLATSFGPWGMMSLPARQQAERLRSILAEAGALEEGRLVRTPELSPEDVRTANSIVRILDSSGQIGRLRPLFAGREDDPFAASEEERLREITRLLAVDVVPRLPAADGSFWFGPGEPAALRLDGYDLVLPNLTWSLDQPARQVEIGATGFEISTAADGLTIRSGARTVVVPSEELRSTIESLLAAMPTRRRESAIPLVEVNVDGARIGLLFDSIAGKLDEKVAVNGGRFLLFLRSSDW